VKKNLLFCLFAGMICSLCGRAAAPSTQAQSFFIDAKGRLESKTVTLTLIPYYAWNHRGAGQMTVWLPQEMSAVIPTK
jgi:DUF1680 family protein